MPSCRTLRHLIVCAALVGAAVPAATQPRQAERPRKPDVFYMPTPQRVVDAMLEIASVTASDVVYDLGSGDGRIPITAAKMYGARGVGIDIDPERINEANSNARAAGVTEKVRFLNEDLFKADISAATVVTLFLTPSLNISLLPKLNRELKPGTRIVSHRWEMKDVAGREYLPRQKLLVEGSNVYLWTIPIE
jgi:SAM-dependent methyltransferase